PATATSSLAVTTASTTPAGTYTLTITGVSGTLTHTSTVTLVVNPAPNFTLAGSPASQTATQDRESVEYVTSAPANGFSRSVTRPATGLPAGATGTSSPNPATATSSLAVTTASSTPAGTYTLTITGVSGTLTHTSTVTLVVNPAPNFTLAGSPASQTATQGNGASYTTTITPTNGFNGSLTLSLTGLPTGATGTFTPNPATTTSALAVTTSATTPAGSYTLTIAGVSGTLTRTATVTLTVASGSSIVAYDSKVSSGFKWGVSSITTPAFTIGTGANRAAMIMVTMYANNATAITAKLGGVTGTPVPGTDTGTTASIRTLIFQVINPPSGSRTATVSWTTAMSADVGVV